MNLDIQLAWCNHWVRDRLGIPPSGSILLFVTDARGELAHSQRPYRQSIQHAISEARWQFANPVSVMLSITDRSTIKPFSLGSELHGLVDQHHTVCNATDLCGWLGASKSIFILTAPSGESRTNQDIQSASAESINLHQALKYVCSGFSKPWNQIPTTPSETNQLKLDWESLHQPSPIEQRSHARNASISFMQAVQILEIAILRKDDPASKNQETPMEYRKAG